MLSGHSLVATAAAGRDITWAILAKDLGAVSLTGAATLEAPQQPTWAQISVGTVAPISGTNTINAVQQTLTSYTGLGDPERIIRAWCGGCLATISGEQYLVIHGGGHSDYGGNEVLKFGPLSSNTPTWSVVSLPTPDAQVVQEAAYNDDGKPNISHTYGLLAAMNGRMYRLGQPGVWFQATAYSTIDSVDLATGVWAAQGTHTNTSITDNGFRGVSLADPTRNVIWYISDQFIRLHQFNPTENSWTRYAPTPSIGAGLYMSAAYCQSRDEVCASYGSNGTTALFNLASPGSSAVTSGFTGTPAEEASGLTWDIGRSVYASLSHNLARNIIRELNPVTKTWSQRTFTGTYETAATDTGYGVNGRFQYVAALKGYIYVGRTTGSVYFYRSHA